jgi:small subunit ribosomal protein S21
MAHSGDFQDSHGANMGPWKRAVKRRNRATTALPNAIVLCYKPPASAGAASALGHIASAHANEGVPTIVNVVVRDNNVDQALKALKKKMQREGVFREMKLRRAYEKPSERKAREKAEAVRRHRKLLRKRMDREGY